VSVVGWSGVDVYEEEEDVFYQNLSEEVLHDDMLARLMVHAHLAVAHSHIPKREA
jgi:D-lactate dehydrogenase